MCLEKKNGESHQNNKFELENVYIHQKVIVFGLQKLLISNRLVMDLH